MANEHDQELIRQAREMEERDYSLHYEVYLLRQQAQTKEAKDELRRIGTRMYHNEEYYCGLL